MKLDARIPPGPLPDKWQRRQQELELIAPNRKRDLRVLVVGTGLAGASAAASLGQLGYRVESFCFQDSARRAHSVAAQGGINAAKDYQNDGDSVWRLFYDTVEGGDFRSREANVYRLAQLSVNIIDQAVAQGVPFAREYGGLLENRSFGGVQVSRTFYARGQTGQQLLMGAYGALARQVRAGTVRVHPRTEMLDLVVEEGRARGLVTRDLVNGEIRCWDGDAVVLASGGYSNVFFLSTNAIGCNVTATYRAFKRGAGFANPCFTQIHPTCIPPSGHHQSKLTLMSESLRNDARIWVPADPDDERDPDDIPDEERDYYLERLFPAFGNLVTRDLASRAAKRRCDEGYGVGPNGQGVYLDLRDAIEREGMAVIQERYGNLFEIYESITGDDPTRVPMRIHPAPHYAMGGLWVDYDLMTTIPGLFAVGEANFSDHGANRLGASALMQGLADGYFVLPVTLGDYLAREGPSELGTDADAFARVREDASDRGRRLLAVEGGRSAADFHRELGRLLWERCGMLRSREGLEEALQRIPELRAEFWEDVCVPGDGEGLNPALERAGRVADFLEFGELMCRDALAREESCGTHFRDEYQTEEGRGLRDDEHWCKVSVWEDRGPDEPARLHAEPLDYENVEPITRSYR